MAIIGTGLCVDLLRCQRPAEQAVDALCVLVAADVRARCSRTSHPDSVQLARRREATNAAANLLNLQSGPRLEVLKTQEGMSNPRFLSGVCHSTSGPTLESRSPSRCVRAWRAEGRQAVDKMPSIAGGSATLRRRWTTDRLVDGHQKPFGTRSRAPTLDPARVKLPHLGHSAPPTLRAGRALSKGPL